MPIEMQCTGCEGDGCNECNKTGKLVITCCPMEYITDDVWEVIRFAELYEKGLPPVAGGALDQAYNFIKAADFIMKENIYWKSRQETRE